jgi:hypothetical protein
VHPELSGVPLHPVQLYTALVNLLGFALAVAALGANAVPGIVAGGALVFHGLARTVLERFRYDLDESGRRDRMTLGLAAASVALGLVVAGQRLARAGFSAPAPLAHTVSLRSLADSVGTNLGVLVPLSVTAFSLLLLVLGVRR